MTRAASITLEVMVAMQAAELGWPYEGHSKASHRLHR
jgi:hypothetical protein